MIKKNGINTCLTDCVAYLLKLDSKNVPLFIKHRFWLSKSLKHWLLYRGYKYNLIEYEPNLFKKLRGEYIVTGKSPRSKAKSNNMYDRRILHHSAVYKNGKMIFDPAKAKKGIITPFYILKISKIKI